MSTFLVRGSLITNENDTCHKWADHFEALGTPAASTKFDNDFASRVCECVEDIFKACLDDIKRSYLDIKRAIEL